jgi:hypothetical protein
MAPVMEVVRDDVRQVVQVDHEVAHTLVSKVNDHVLQDRASSDLDHALRQMIGEGAES